jgi:transcriptional regulator with XRE-family HTH domain
MHLETREIYYLKRRKLGLTLETIASDLHINKSTVSRWETGKTHMPKEYINYISDKERMILNK